MAGTYPDALNFQQLASLRLGPKPTREQAIAKSYIKAGSVMTDVQIVTRARYVADGLRQVTLQGSGGWGEFNADGVSLKNLPEDWKEGKYYRVDHWEMHKSIFMQEGAPSEAKAFQRKMAPDLDYRVFDFNLKFFNNRHTGPNDIYRDQNCYVGIRERLAEAGVLTSKYRIPAEMSYQSEVDLSPMVRASDSSLKANANLLMKEIEDRLESMGRPEGDDVIIWMGQDMYSVTSMGLRAMGAGGGWKMTVDAFDREMIMYKNAKVRRAGRTAPTQGLVQSQILTNTEPQDGKLPTASGGIYGSIFFTLTGPGDFVIERFTTEEPSDPFLLPDGVTRRVVMWNFYGLVQENNRALAQIHGIQLQDS